MRHTFGKTLGGLLAALCLVSTLAMAGEMTCTASDGKGNCTAATGPDGTTLVVVGEGLKVGELLDWQDRGPLINGHALPHADPRARPPVPPPCRGRDADPAPPP